MKNFLKNNLGFIITIIVIILVRMFAFTPLYVDGISMNPTLEDGDFIILNKLDSSFERFDTVVIDEDFSGKGLIKRVVAVAGDKISCKNNEVYVNGEKLEQVFLAEGTYTEDIDEVTVPEGFYYVLGDNREHSLDSREYGFIDAKYIQGKAEVILFPFSRIGSID